MAGEPGSAGSPGADVGAGGNRGPLAQAAFTGGGGPTNRLVIDAWVRPIDAGISSRASRGDHRAVCERWMSDHPDPQYLRREDQRRPRQEPLPTAQTARLGQTPIG